MSKKLTRKEREQLKFQIVQDNQMLIKMRNFNRVLFSVSAMLIILSVFLYNADTFLPNLFGTVLRWILYIATVIAFIVSILSLVSFFNAKRRIKYYINIYDGKVEPLPNKNTSE
ncbi:MAG: hypothetical protein QM266_02650 [Bacillota bacterium]|jgi:uncharacterized Tic20 family protein|nr:hypothetical protein [Bacillota bacterium]NLP22465.1 hypothetical protein [Erysipelotrichaceae bacterium]